MKLIQRANWLQQDYERLKQAELDAKAERYKRNKKIAEALKVLANKASLCGINDDGTLYIYDGTFEAMLDVYRAMGWNE